VTILASGWAVVRSTDAASQQQGQRPYTLDEYFALSARVRTGDIEHAVTEIENWNRRAFRDLRDQLSRLRKSLEGPSQLILDTWGRADIEGLAMLHTEAAIRSSSLSTKETSHANWAKQLLDLFEGLGVDQSFRRRWHVAWGAHLQATLRLQELADHVDEALRKWQDDPDLLTMAGSVYESSAQRSVMLRTGSDYVPMQLQRRERPNPDRTRALAERYYRQALDVQPELFDASLRLGRILLETSRSDEALAQLTHAATRATSSKERYLARLFLGRAYVRTQRWQEAIAAYTDADSLLPQCQTAALALSHAYLRQGNKEQAQAQVTIALDRSKQGRCEDPWWEYEFGYGRRADALLEELRQKLRP
jgi:tetratricopeptide (TPR) repeat protein